ncbi:hypothetical protein [Desertibaculum subflavum]|uniref:hypothetical protein n=1 Tax=Desertibaculum subflavum TaxID=2268458 RepID=UPI000E66E911
MSHTPAYPRKHSPAEWSFIYRRRNVLRAIRHRHLTPAAKQVMVYLSLLTDDPFVMAERPDVAALARRLALAERTVRHAIAELVEHRLLTFRQTGEPYHANDPSPENPSERPDLTREKDFLAQARGPITFAEQIDMLHHLRERAVAARRIATAVQAERAIGRALGLAQAPKPPPREPTEYQKIPLNERKRRVFESGVPDLPRLYAADPQFGPELRRLADQAEILIGEHRAAEAQRERQP